MKKLLGILLLGLLSSSNAHAFGLIYNIKKLQQSKVTNNGKKINIKYLKTSLMGL